MPLADNLIAYWSLEEASGNAIDAHGANDLTEAGGTIASTTGKVDNCRDFEKADTEWFELADNTDLSTGDIDFTWQCWFNAETLADFPVVFRKGPSGNNREYILFYDTSASRLMFLVGTGSATAQVQWGSALSTATWYHVICWHDSVNNQIGIAVNAGTAVTTAHSGGVLDSNGVFEIGAGTSQSLYWDGLIDEVGLWKRVLTSDERTELYNSGNGRDYAYITAEEEVSFQRIGGMGVGRQIVGPQQIL